MMNAVQFGHDMPVTNARCCSNPRVQCERCAAAALALHNGGGAIVVNSLWDDDDEDGILDTPRCRPDR